MPPVLTIVRHGQTEANVSRVWHGSTDTALTETGRAQAKAVAAAVAKRFSPCAIISSDLQRARGTAEAIGEAVGVEVSVDPRLREYGLGDWEGRTFGDLQKAELFYERITRDPDFAPPGGESSRGVTERMIAAMTDASAHEGRVVLVTHGGALSLALGWLKWRQYELMRHLTHNCAVTELVLDPFELISFNSKWI